MILVMAASGMFGSAVVRGLVKAGAPVRATSSRLDSLQMLSGPGVELVAADMDDPASLDTLMDGVTRIFVNAPMDDKKEAREKNVIAAAVRSGQRPHLVLLTGGVQHDDALGDAGRAIEQAMRDSGLPWTIVGPQTVMESNFYPWKESIQRQNAIVACCGDAPIGFVALADVAGAFVTVLTSTGVDHVGKTYIITGPDTATWDDVAAGASRALGRTIAYVDMPRAEYRSMMIQWGAFTEQNVDIGIMMHQDAFRAGKAALVNDDYQMLTGKPAMSVAAWWEQHADFFLAPTQETKPTTA